MSSSNSDCTWKAVGGDRERKLLHRASSCTHHLPDKSNTSYTSPLIIAVLICCFGAWIVSFQQTEPSYQENLNAFAGCWCLVQGASVLINFSRQIRFYKWFIRSDISEACNRGFSTKGFNLFGCIPMPSLSTNQLILTGFVYTASLVLMAYCFLKRSHFEGGFAVPTVALVALGTSLLYFSSLWAERTCSYHRECVTIATLLYLLLASLMHTSPPLVLQEGQEGQEEEGHDGQQATTERLESAAYIILLLKVHIASIYFAGGLQKLACSFLQGESWPLVTPHSLIWQAMWSKPYFPSLQRAAFIQPGMVAIGGSVVLVAELILLPVVVMPQIVVGTLLSVLPLPFTVYLPQLLAFVMVGFHTSVFLIQGIDYVTFWSPALLIYLCPDTNTGQTIESLFDVLKALINTESHSTACLSTFLSTVALELAVVFCGSQVLFALTLLEDWNINIPPFTCCPMFANIVSLFDHDCRYYTMWDHRAPVCYEQLEWLCPFVKSDFGVGMIEKDLAKMPFKFIGFGYYARNKYATALQAPYYTGELLYNKEGFYIYSNYKVSEELQDRLQNLIELMHSHSLSVAARHAGKFAAETPLSRIRQSISLPSFALKNESASAAQRVAAIDASMSSMRAMQFDRAILNEIMNEQQACLEAFQMDIQ